MSVKTFDRNALKLVVRILQEEYKRNLRSAPLYAHDVHMAKEALIDYVGRPEPILPKLGAKKEVDIMAVTDDVPTRYGGTN